MRVARVFIITLLSFHLGLTTLAADTPARVVSLEEALKLALNNNLDLHAKQSLLAQAQARQEQARAAAYPKVLGTAILSPTYAVTGNALDSANDLDRWGVWVQSTVTILQPIYTWGKLSSLREAAAHGTEVARAQLKGDRQMLAFKVKELYYGAILAEQLYNFLADGKKDVEEVLEKTEADQKKKRSKIAKRDYYRLKIFAAEANYRLEEAEKLRKLARHGLSLLLGFDPDEQTAPQETMIQAIDAPVPNESELLDQMMDQRPELTQLRNGILAKQALLEVERTNKYPMFFAGGLLSFNYSNVREKQNSAFAFDPYNRNTGGAGVGVQWAWDFATTLANEALIRTEIDQLERTREYARAGFRMELKKALAELKEAQAKLDASKEAFRIGRKWLVSETMGHSLGVGEIKNLIDAYLARAKTAKDHWEALYRVNMSWAALAKTVGAEITPGLASASGVPK